MGYTDKGCRKGSRPHGYTDKGRVERGIEPPVLSYILQRPIRSVQYCEYVLYRMYYRYHTERRNPLSDSASPVLGVMRGNVRGRLATTEALSYILQRPIRSVQILRIYPSISGQS
jgi:hypothetical protein